MATRPLPSRGVITNPRGGARAPLRSTRVRLRPCGADINSESSSSPPLALSSPPPALLSPQARSSPPPALSPAPELSPLALSSLVLLAGWTPERSLSTSTVRTELMQTTAAEPEEAAAPKEAVVDH